MKQSYWLESNMNLDILRQVCLILDDESLWKLYCYSPYRAEVSKLLASNSFFHSRCCYLRSQDLPWQDIDWKNEFRHYVSVANMCGSHVIKSQDIQSLRRVYQDKSREDWIATGLRIRIVPYGETE